MTTHQLATLLDHLRTGFGDGLKSTTSTEFEDVSTLLRELPDQSLKELAKQIRKVAAPISAKSGAVVDVPALIARIRDFRNTPSDSPPAPIDLNAMSLNNAQLKDILKAFAEKPTTTVAGNLAKVQQLLRSGTAHSNGPSLALAQPDLQTVEEGVRLYNALLADRTLSITDVRAGFEPLKGHSKPVLEEISRRLAYTPVGSKTAILARLLDNLEGIKLSQHRADRILAGTGS